MTPGDQSQLPVEHLAQLLLRHARDDAALAKRSVANDDDMLGRLEALATSPKVQSEPEPPQPVPPTHPPPHLPPRLPTGRAGTGSMAALEELVAIALTSAQDAEDLSRAASRRVRLGVAAAIAVGLAGVAIGAFGVIGAQPQAASPSQFTDIAGQIRSLDTLQHQINDQLARLQARQAEPDAGVQSVSAPAGSGQAMQTASAVQDAGTAAGPAQAVQEADAEAGPAQAVQESAAAAGPVSVAQDTSAAAAPQPGDAAQPTLPPLNATPVRILPAHTAIPTSAPDGPAPQPRPPASPIAYTPGAFPSPEAWGQPATLVSEPSAEERPPPRPYRRAVVMPPFLRRVVYAIRTLPYGLVVVGR